MNQNFAGMTLLLILTAGGIATNDMLVVILAAVTAALAFLTEEARRAVDTSFGNLAILTLASTIFAGLSWLAVGAALIALVL